MKNVVLQRKLDFFGLDCSLFAPISQIALSKWTRPSSFETRLATTQIHVHCATKLCCLLFPFLSHCTVPLHRVHSTTTNPASLPPTSQRPLFHHHHHHTGASPPLPPALKLKAASSRAAGSLFPLFLPSIPRDPKICANPHKKKIKHKHCTPSKNSTTYVYVCECEVANGTESCNGSTAFIVQVVFVRLLFTK